MKEIKKPLEYICMDLNKSLIQTFHQTVDEIFLRIIGERNFHILFEEHVDFCSEEAIKNFSRLFSLEKHEGKIKKGACNLNKLTIKKDNKQLSVYYYETTTINVLKQPEEGYFLYLTEFSYI